jgi:hypothetical protein
MSSAPKQRPPTFIDLYLRGKCLPEDIDDFVDAWHERPGKQELYEFLGMTEEEYSLWVRDPDALPRIAHARRTNVPLASIVLPRG